MTSSHPVEVKVPLHGAVLHPEGPWHRRAPRSLEFRQSDYDDRFDTHTLFYDVFRIGGNIELIGPPLLNLEEGLRPLDLRGRGRRYARRLTSSLKDRLHRHVISEVPQQVSTLSMSCALGRFRLEIGEDLANHFSGSRLLVTQSRNNPLPWIAEWVDHHVEAHGIDAVILYDNDSSAYSPEDIRTVLGQRPGLASFAVVEWPYPFGPTGGPGRRWDSDYGQHGVWEHAFRRLGRLASTITFADVDELIVGPGPSVPDRALTSPHGICSYQRRSILAVPHSRRRRRDDRRRYRDYLLFDPEAPLLSPKYTVVPSALDPQHQLMVHRVDGLTYAHEPELLARHFDGMRIEWREGEVSPVEELLKSDIPRGRTAIDNELRREFAGEATKDYEQDTGGNT